MRQLDSISILNSRQGIKMGKLVEAKLLHCNGIVLGVDVSDHLRKEFHH
jgi:hypothetical protein